MAPGYSVRKLGGGIILEGEYAVELLREGTEEAPALFRLTDWCRANMFLVVGSERAMLVDGGYSHDAAIVDLPEG